MNSYHDPELDDVLQDAELRRIASMLHSARRPEPPLDDAFRTGLRRQLMREAWSMAEGRQSWWRRAFAPPGIAWAGAVAGLLLIAAVTVWYANQQAGGLNEVVVGSAIDGKSNVALQQPILVSFNQPMDHQSTQDAVQIKPATNVTFAWDTSSRTLWVTPVSGDLAPNTQYQVTIGAGAKTAKRQPLAAPQTITFVTQPTAPESPAPSSPRPTPTNPLGEKQIGALSGAATPSPQWSADSTSVYFVDGKGALLVANAKTGSQTVIAPDGASSPSISPAGDRLAYLRGGKIEVLTFASGQTDETSPAATPTLVGWAKERLVWATAGGVFQQSANKPAMLAPLPTTGTVSVISFAPDGAHAVYRQDQTLFLLDLSSGKSVQLGSAADAFGGWSSDGTQLVYATADHVVVADTQGVSQSSLPAGQASWSSQDAILLGGDTTLYEVRPDGSNLTRLSNGTYHTPVWAPDGSSFAFVRGDSLWVATAPPLPAQPTLVDEAGAVVKRFMDARLNGKADDATALLDANGKKAYGSGGLSLLITGDPHFSRYYVLTQEALSTQPDTVRAVVRLVLSKGKKDVSEAEETLTLVRDASSKQFLIDQAAAGSQRELGKGPEVVSVSVGQNALQVTFDSDLDPGTVRDGVMLVDSKGNQVDGTVAYANRIVSISGLDLKEGASYRLLVLASVRDVQGHNVAAQYELSVFGPSVKKHTIRRPVATAPSGPATGSPSASPR